MMEIWFWQLIISPHTANLAVALSKLGHRVIYVAEQEMTPDRAAQGWVAPELQGVNIEWMGNIKDVESLVLSSSPDSIHICQGMRSNGLISNAQRELSKRGIKNIVLMETVNDTGWRGVIKRIVYRNLLKASKNLPVKYLAIGHRTREWLIARGAQPANVVSFSYFLSPFTSKNTSRATGPFRFLYVGRMVPLKRVEWVLDCVSNFEADSCELWLVGSGEDEGKLKLHASKKISNNKVIWYGGMSMSKVFDVMSQVDCLLLPSFHDGWGAVASEAMIAGTPVICSDSCGVAGVVGDSGFGGVFPRDDRVKMELLMREQLERGPINEESRVSLKKWATCLTVDAGAKYLLKIITHESNEELNPPWKI